MTLFLYPPSTRYGKAVPKSRVYEHANAGKPLQRLFVSQVDRIVWEHVLSARTLNLRESPDIREIQVFTIHLREETPDPRVLRALDESIPSSLILELVHGHRVRMAVAWKRPHLQDPAHKVVGDHFFGPWQFLPGKRAPLPFVQDLRGLQEHIFRTILPSPPRDGESLGTHMERVERLETARREADRLRRQIEREPQFNKRMEAHTRLQQLEAQARSLD